MKIFWSWQSDTPGMIGRFLVRDALNDAIERLKQASDIEEANRQSLHLDQDIQGVPGSPDLVPAIFGKIEKAEVVVADVTIIGKTSDGDSLINSNVAIELGFAWRACTDERVLLVFNRHYGSYEDLPFDLRHKGGAVVFELPPGAQRQQIDVQRKSLVDEFARKLRPILELPSRIRQPLSLRPILEHRRDGVFPLPGGGSDERFLLEASLKNDGEQDATDFRLDVEIPGEFLDESGHRLLVASTTPGSARFQITNRDVACQIEHLYPGDRTKPLISVHYAVRDEMKKQRQKDLEKRVTATAYSGNMKPKAVSMTIGELMRDPHPV